MFVDKTYISFSGGKDSTVLLDLVRKLYPDAIAVFVDTGLEFPELKQFVNGVQNVKILRPEMSFRKVIDTYGYPLISKSVAHSVNIARRNPNGKVKINLFDQNKKGQYAMYKWSFLLENEAPIISEKCCDMMKKKPMRKFQKETGLKPFLGTMANESVLRRDKWLQNGCNAFDNQNPISAPLSFWTENDILNYIKRNHLRYASVYGEIIQNKKGDYITTGCHRTGCVFCGFGCHLEKEPNRFQRLKQTHPQLWEYCMKDWDKGGLGMKEVLAYIGVKTE